MTPIIASELSNVNRLFIYAAVFVVVAESAGATTAADGPRRGELFLRKALAPTRTVSLA